MKYIYFKYHQLINRTFVILLILVSYLFFPTHNSSLDSFAYAGYVKYNYSLFTPHHLLSNAIIFVLIKPLYNLNFTIDILLFSKFVNSTFQFLNLFIFYKILSFLKVKETSKLLYILILAFSFSLWRYGTENETYIIPITFSLLSSFYYIKHLYKFSYFYIFISSLFGIIACLFHQIHVFWWLGLFVGFLLFKRNIKVVFYYLLPSILLPITYCLVIYFYNAQEITFTNFQYFVLNDFYKGTVVTNFGWKGVFFQIINTFRTYFQIHPNIYLLIKHNLIYAFPLVFCLFIGLNILYQIRKKRKILLKKENYLKIIIQIHIGIFVCNYLFAYYNNGNVEFMVMLPYILILCVIIKYNIDQLILLRLAVLLFIWNFSYGIFPNYNYNYFNDDVLVDFMINNKDKTYIIERRTTINHYFYKTGIYDPKNIFLLENVSETELQNLVDKNKTLYTDVINKPEILNKAKISSENKSLDLNTYTNTNLFYYDSFYGKNYLHKISKK